MIVKIKRTRSWQYVHGLTLTFLPVLIVNACIALYVHCCPFVVKGWSTNVCYGAGIARAEPDGEVLVNFVVLRTCLKKGGLASEDEVQNCIV